MNSQLDVTANESRKSESKRTLLATAKRPSLLEMMSPKE